MLVKKGPGILFTHDPDLVTPEQAVALNLRHFGRAVDVELVPS